MGPKLSPGRHRIPASKLWPKRASQIIDAGIAAVEIEGAREALQTAQNMKGDEKAVLAVADKWRAAADEILKAMDPLNHSWRSLTSDWEGGAYTAFQSTASFNAQTAVDNCNALLAAEAALLDLSIQVANAYNLAVDLTTLAATRIQPALGRIGLTSTKKDDKPAITKALQDYIEGVNKTDTSLRTAITTQKVGIAKISLELTKLKPPAHLPETAENPKRWTYK